MEPYGHGEVMLKVNKDIIILHNIHHQFKFLVLHGKEFILVIKEQWQVRVMEQYGDGEIMVMDV